MSSSTLCAIVGIFIGIWGIEILAVLFFIALRWGA
jgi:hypothetical protein